MTSILEGQDTPVYSLAVRINGGLVYPGMQCILLRPTMQWLLCVKNSLFSSWDEAWDLTFWFLGCMRIYPPNLILLSQNLQMIVKKNIMSYPDRSKKEEPLLSKNTKKFGWKLIPCMGA